MAGLLTRGHPAAAAAVAAMIAGPSPHAVLLSGPSGVGKTTLALDLAAGLLCTAAEPADRPCRACRGCGLVERGRHADLHRLAPSGPGDVIGIGGQPNRPPGIRNLISDLALLPVEGGARVALLERADRMTEDAQSALLKTLEEPPARLTLILCADNLDGLLPTVRSRCIRVRLGPVATRDIEALLGDQGVADAPTAARLARIAGGRPGHARAWALTPEAVTARDEIARTVLDMLEASASRRLALGRDMLARASDVVAALDRTSTAVAGGEAAEPKRGRRGRSGGPSPTRSTSSEATTTVGGQRDLVEDRPNGKDDPEDETETEAVVIKASAGERRRAVATIVAIWRDVARDLALVGLGEERRLRDVSLIDDLRASAVGVPLAAIPAFLARLDRTAELVEANVGPELALDVLVLAWPRRHAA